MRQANANILILDARGLIAFTIVGCDVALAMDYHPVVVTMSGMITGIAGGILRDILCNRVPIVFRRELYVSVSLLVAMLYLGLSQLAVPHDYNIAASFISGLTLRLTALWRELQLPTFSYRHENH